MASFISTVFRRFRLFGGHISLMYRAFRHPDTPPAARVFALLTIVYLFSPVDIVPDLIPFAGWLDDIVLVPFLLSVGVRLLPEHVVKEISIKKAGGLPVFVRITGWILLIAGIIWLLWLVFRSLFSQSA